MTGKSLEEPYQAPCRGPLLSSPARALCRDRRVADRLVAGAARCRPDSKSSISPSIELQPNRERRSSIAAALTTAGSACEFRLRAWASRLGISDRQIRFRRRCHQCCEVEKEAIGERSDVTSSYPNRAAS